MLSRKRSTPATSRTTASRSPGVARRVRSIAAAPRVADQPSPRPRGRATIAATVGARLAVAATTASLRTFSRHRAPRTTGRGADAPPRAGPAYRTRPPVGALMDANTGDGLAVARAGQALQVHRLAR